MKNTSFPTRVFLVLLVATCGCGGADNQTEAGPAGDGEQTLQSPYLAQIAQLQATAEKANSGAMGCGFGTFTIERTDGTKVASASGLDPIHVFGAQIRLKDILPLLEARRRAVETGRGPMSGDVSDLCYVVLHTVGESGDPAALPYVQALVNDPNTTIRRCATISLTSLEKSIAAREAALAAAAAKPVRAAQIPAPNSPTKGMPPLEQLPSP